MKYRHITAVILGLIAVLAVVAYTPLRNQFKASDGILPETETAGIIANNTDSILSQQVQNNEQPPTSKDWDKNTSTDFIVSPDAPALWPIVLQKEPVVVQRHNLISAWKIALDRQLIDQLAQNDQLNLYIPQTDRRVTITLNSTKSGRYSQSKIGTIDGSDGAYSAYFTLGVDTLYASIETPEGVFHIEQNSTGEAMIYAASEIRKNLDYSVSDAIVVLPPVNGVD